MQLRPVHAADAAAVQVFVRSLSARSRYERFLAPVAELSAGQLERVIAGSGLSLAALDGAGAIVGLAEYARTGAREAEIAVVVADGLQGLGIGTRLLMSLLEHARRSGLARLGGVTRAGNQAMRHLARRVGFIVRRDADPALVRFELELALAA